MSFTIGAIAAKDGSATTIGGGLLAADTTGGGAGPWFLFQGLVDGVAGSNKAQVTAANALKVDNSGVTQTVAQATAANLNATVVGTGTFAVQATQSGNWAVRSQDGSGNALTSATRGAERALSVQIVDGSGTQITAFGGSGGTASNFGSAIPVSGTAAGWSDGTNMQSPRVFDADTGAGTQYVPGVLIKVPASGGSVDLAMGSGATSAATVRTTLASDSAGIISTGTAGTPSSQVLSTQGVVGGTPLPNLPTLTAAANGLTKSRVNAGASTNATSLKASAGNVASIQVFNTAAYTVFLKMYNKASAPTVGTDTPVWTIPVAAGGGFSDHFPLGDSFSTGIAYAITKLQADSDTTAVAAGDLTGQIRWI